MLCLPSHDNIAKATLHRRCNWISDVRALYWISDLFRRLRCLHLSSLLSFPRIRLTCLSHPFRGWTLFGVPRDLLYQRPKQRARHFLILWPNQLRAVQRRIPRGASWFPSCILEKPSQNYSSRSWILRNHPTSHELHRGYVQVHI